MKKAACFARDVLVKRDVGIGPRFLRIRRKRKVSRLQRICGNFVSCCEQTLFAVSRGREEGQLSG